MEALARHIMNGRLQAASIAALFAGLALLLPPLWLVSNAAIALVTLRLGWQQSVLTVLLASAALLVLGFLFASQAVLIVALAQWIPVMLLAGILARSISWTRTLQALLIISISFVALFYLAVGDVKAFWQAYLLHILEPLFADVEKGVPDLKDAISQLAPWFTGVIMTMMVLVWISSLLLARYWQALLFNPGGFHQEFHQLRVGQIPALLMLVMVALSLFNPDFIFLSEVVMLGLFVFMFQGLSMSHALIKHLNMNKAWLVGIYFLLIFATQAVAVMLGTLGAVDNFADFRRRMIKQDEDQK